MERDAGTGIDHERPRPRLRERQGSPVAHDDGGAAEQPGGAEALPVDGDGTGGHPPRDGPVDPRHRPLGSRSGQSVAEGSHVAVEGSATVHLEHGEPPRRQRGRPTRPRAGTRASRRASEVMVARRVAPGTRNHHPRAGPRSASAPTTGPHRTPPHGAVVVRQQVEGVRAGPALAPGEGKRDGGDRGLRGAHTRDVDVVAVDEGHSHGSAVLLLQRPSQQVRRHPLGAPCPADAVGTGPGGRHRDRRCGPRRSGSGARPSAPARASRRSRRCSRSRRCARPAPTGQVEPMQVAALRERDIEEPQLVDVQPLGRRDASSGLPVIEMGASPALYVRPARRSRTSTTDAHFTKRIADRIPSRSRSSRW